MTNTSIQDDYTCLHGKRDNSLTYHEEAMRTVLMALGAVHVHDQVRRDGMVLHIASKPAFDRAQQLLKNGGTTTRWTHRGLGQ